MNAVIFKTNQRTYILPFWMVCCFFTVTYQGKEVFPGISLSLN